jgi:hypothetical protein
MNTTQNKISLKQLVGLVGLASASVFFSIPAQAETPTGCGGYQGNATTGGGYYCALDRINRTSSNSDASTTNPQSTTGTSYPGNGGTSNSGANTTESPSTNSSSSTTEQPSTTTQSSTTEQRSTTTTTSSPANTVTPTTGATTTQQPQPSTTEPTTTNQSTDQGVRALW